MRIILLTRCRHSRMFRIRVTSISYCSLLVTVGKSCVFALTFEPLDRVLYKAQPTVYDALSKKNLFFPVQKLAVLRTVCEVPDSCLEMKTGCCVMFRDFQVRVHFRFANTVHYFVCRKRIQDGKICGSFQIQTNQPTRCNSFTSLLLDVLCGSTCFGRLHAHHQEITTALTASGFYLSLFFHRACCYRTLFKIPTHALCFKIHTKTQSLFNPQTPN